MGGTDLLINELKSELTKSHVRKLYVFTGIETAVRDVYIQKISEVSGKPLRFVNNLSAIHSKLKNKTFDKSLYCYVIKDDPEVLKQDKIWEGLKEGTSQGNHVVILCYNSLDKRGKFYKQFEDLLTEFGKLSDNVLAKYIMKDLDIPFDYAKELANICSCDYCRVKLESDKILQLSSSLNISNKDAYTRIMQDRLIYVEPKDAIFELVSSICLRNIKGSYYLWKESRDSGENPLVVVSVLYNNIRSMLLVSLAGKGEGIATRTGLTPFQCKLARESIGHYSNSEMLRALKCIRYVEKQVKQGTMPADIAVDYILVNIL